MRLWFYFRIGYGTYLNFLLGFVTTVVSVYYLAIKNIPILQLWFPSFAYFTILAAVAGIPTCVLVGYAHFKRVHAYSSEQDITAESNPYNFKLPPGFMRTAFMPLYIEILSQLKQIRINQGGLSTEEQTRLENIEGTLRKLQSGEIA